MRTQYELGLEGESLAQAHLESLGMRVVERRVRMADGEIDLIAVQGKKLYFVEVKYRPQGRLGEGLLAVTPDKARRFRACMRAYLRQHPFRGRICPVVLEITRAGILMESEILR